MADSFSAKSALSVAGKSFSYYSLQPIYARFPEAKRLPFSLKILLENLVRNEDDRTVTAEDIEALAKWDAKAQPDKEIAFRPGRVLLQDFTGVPAVCDLAGMRDAVASLGGDPDRINPLEPVDLVIDHSVQVDKFGSQQSFGINVALEHQRNAERYQLLRWGQNAFAGFRAVPPGTGICHQVNLEFLASVVLQKNGVVYPDSLVGTDSHTTMINGLGVLGWGVGGIEAEAAMLGQPVSMLIPQVVGMKLTGTLREGATATDLVLTVTQLLRKKGVVGKFVEFFGPGVQQLSLPNRATIANMAPEYGATMGFFAVDEETINFLRFSGRSEEQAALVEAYAKAQGLWFSAGDEPSFSDTLELDLGSVEPSLAGPKRPQDRIALTKVKEVYQKSLAELGEKGREPNKTMTVKQGRQSYELPQGAVVIAAITSCTNTSNPSVLIAAGLVAKRAVERGIQVKPWVKTSLAPGSQVVSEYLKEAGLIPYLEAIGFHVVGYGCTTCIGNSGPLPEPVATAIKQGDLVVASVLSGNRNFEGRVNSLVRMNFLASPPLVVAYALAGEMGIDLYKEPIGYDHNGAPVTLAEIWPSNAEVEETLRRAVRPEQFRAIYSDVFRGDEHWQKLRVPTGKTFVWDDKSTYVRRPPYFENVPKEPGALSDVVGARVLLKLGDSITTDHISPAGEIDSKGPAAEYLRSHGVAEEDFNQFGARRGNHEVMMRGTFANVRLKNQLVPGTEGGFSVHLPDGKQGSVFDTAMQYQQEGTPTIVLAGAEYGTGSSRDWAAKGPRLLGIRAVIAKSFERIHRSNLVGMGVLPCEFVDGQDAESLGLTGKETFDIRGVADGITPGKLLDVVAKSDDGQSKSFKVKARIDTPNEVDYFRHGGILLYVLRQIVKQ